jgi:hypothetical protein
MLLMRCAGAVVLLRVLVGGAVLLLGLLALLVVLSANAAALQAMANIATKPTLPMLAIARPLTGSVRSEDSSVDSTCL